MTTNQENAGKPVRHVAARRWTAGGFHTLRYIECRCGETFVHYNAGEVRRMFRAHQEKAA